VEGDLDADLRMLCEDLRPEDLIWSQDPNRLHQSQSPPGMEEGKAAPARMEAAAVPARGQPPPPPTWRVAVSELEVDAHVRDVLNVEVVAAERAGAAGKKGGGALVHVASLKVRSFRADRHHSLYD
jgi:hypothetical protein